jgi:hypothetical protein
MCSVLKILEEVKGAIVASIFNKKAQASAFPPLDAQFYTAPTKQDAARALDAQPYNPPLHILVKHDLQHETV